MSENRFNPKLKQFKILVNQSDVIDYFKNIIDKRNLTSQSSSISEESSLNDSSLNGLVLELKNIESQYNRDQKKNGTKYSGMGEEKRV